jgi:hypothetical protein
MPHPDPGVLAWASAVLGSEVTGIRSLRLGYPPWLLRAGDRNVVPPVSPFASWLTRGTGGRYREVYRIFFLIMSISWHPDAMFAIMF